MHYEKVSCPPALGKGVCMETGSLCHFIPVVRAGTVRGVERRKFRRDEARSFRHGFGLAGRFMMGGYLHVCLPFDEYH